MQISPSVSLFQALSNLIQPQVVSQVQAIEPIERVPGEAQRAAVKPQSQDLKSDQTVNSFEAPLPGTPIRRGMLVNILA